MFNPGDTLVFNPDSFNQNYWNNLSEEDKLKYYSQYGYGQKQLVLFSFLAEHKPQGGHCLLVNMATGQVLPMCHTLNFRLATDEEC